MPSGSCWFSGKTRCPYAGMNYTAAHIVVEAIKVVGSDIENREQFLAGLKKGEIPDDPRGPFRMDSLGSAQENVSQSRTNNPRSA